MTEVAAAPVAAKSPVKGIPMPRIGAPLADGIFAGIARGAAADHALVLLAEASQKMAWSEAMKWAAELGASLPTRAEQSVIFGNLRDLFPNGGWYWSCEQCAGNESYAWSQYFGDGHQFDDLKGGKLRARAVRSLPLVI